MNSKLEHDSHWNQYIAVGIVCFVAFGQGNVSGWLSPALLKLTSEEKTPLKSGPLTANEVSWLATNLYIGGIIGSLISEGVNSKYGFRICLITLAVPQIIWWLIVYFGNEYRYLLIGRLLAGYTGGSIFKVVPLLVAEIAESEIRGKLGSILPLAYNAGLMSGFALEAYLPQDVKIISILMPIIFIVAVVRYIEEPPQSLLNQGKPEKAYTSLLYYRTVASKKDVPKKVEAEFNGMLNFQRYSSNKEKVPWTKIFGKEARRGMLLSFGLVTVFHFSGQFPLMQFAAPIFVESGSSLSPVEASLVVAVVQVFGVYCSTFFVDRCGRRSLMLVSCCGTAVFWLILGTYSYLDHSGVDVSGVNWIPIASFSLAIYFAAIGIMAISFTIMTEVLLSDIKGIGLSVVNAVGIFLGLILIKQFPDMLIQIQLYGTMWLFAGICLIGMIVFAIFLPETKGKDLNNVQHNV